MKLNKLFICVALLMCVFVGCGEKSDSSGVGSGVKLRKLVITGSSTIAPVLTEMALRYEKKHAGVRIDVQMGGSSRGVLDTRNAVADIGMVSRNAKDSEHDLTWYPVARDGVCIIVHSDNIVQSLTYDQIRAIYRGEVTDWREVGGSAGPITVVHKAEGRSTLEIFLKYFALSNDQVKAHVIVGGNQQGIKTVIGNPASIGYVSVGAAEFEALSGAALRLLPSGGVEASVASITSGQFPISRTLNLVMGSEPSELAQEFTAFCQSSEVEDLIKEHYFVPYHE